ncbi:MAG: hypothetical protein AAF702_16610 [Chloroflexota bacterium]
MAESGKGKEVMTVMQTERNKLLRTFVILAKSTPEQFCKLATTQKELSEMSAAIFLLATRNGTQEILVTSFLDAVVPALLTQLNRTMTPVKVKSTKAIRGKIDWASTLKARYSSNDSQDTFICTRNDRQFDRLENQLLKYVLHNIEGSIARVLPRMAHWQPSCLQPLHRDFNPSVVDEETTATARWLTSGSTVQNETISLGGYCYHQQVRVRTSLRNAYLTNVSLPSRVHQGHLLAAQNTKSHLYLRVVEVYEAHHRLVAMPNLTHWRATLEQVLPLPPGSEEIQQLLREQL